MVTGEKPEEYRVPSKWIEQRLYNADGTKKQYDLIKFVNGYGSKRPYFICKMRGFYKNPDAGRICKYSNGLIVRVGLLSYVIQLGEIIEKGNLKP
jgi:hypothetical protein